VTVCSALIPLLVVKLEWLIDEFSEDNIELVIYRYMTHHAGDSFAMCDTYRRLRSAA
jgi:hypothetical protein